MKQRRSFPADSRSVAESRRFAAQALDGTAPDVIDAVVLMVSELATNCIRHVNSAFSMVVERNRGEIRVEVSDGSGGVPALQSPGPDAPGGRGLRIVEMLSDRWGVDERSAGGKTVWFVIATETSQRRDAQRSAHERGPGSPSRSLEAGAVARRQSPRLSRAPEVGSRR